MQRNLTLALALCATLIGCAEAGPHTATDGGSTTVDDPSPGSDDASCDADLTSDPDHCGGCGHSCRGGACADSACVPLEMVWAGDPVVDLAADDEGVFYTTRAALVRQLVGGPPEVLDVGDEEPRSIALHGDRLYFVSELDYDLKRANKDGSAIEVFASISNLATFALTDDDFYFTLLDRSHVYRAPAVPFGDAVTIFDSSYPTTTGVTATVSAGGGRVCWQSPVVPLTCAAPDGSERVQIVDEQSGDWRSLGGIAGDYLYWKGGPPFPDEMTLHRSTTRGGPILTVAEGVFPRGLASDDQFVYWLGSDGSVRAAPHTGGAKRLLAIDQAPPDDQSYGATLVAAGGRVFWLNGRRVMMVARPL